MWYEIESCGWLVVGGLQLESFCILKNGKVIKENVDFDWFFVEVYFLRDGSVCLILFGMQDILLFNYQFVYLKKLEEGMLIGVVIGKKYECYVFDLLGEEEIDFLVGYFCMLYLWVQIDNVMEIWIVFDYYCLLVKICFIDKKGESFEQVVIELGLL